MRFWLTILVFALCNLAAWFAYHAWQERTLDLVQVESFSPGNDNILRSWVVPFTHPTALVAPAANPSRTYADPLRFRFNLAMDISGDLARQPPGRISPQLAGVWEWDGERELLFKPEQPPLATTFTVTLPRSATKLE